MGDISQHISRDEVSCRCGCGFQTADYELVSVIEQMCDYLKERNSNCERVAVRINSWCRCSEHDIEVQKSHKPEHWRPSGKRSEHLKGWATDFWLEFVYGDRSRIRVHPNVIFNYLDTRFADKYGIGRYKNRTHLDMRPYAARWDNR